MSQEKILGLLSSPAVFETETRAGEVTHLDLIGEKGQSLEQGASVYGLHFDFPGHF